MKRSDMVLAIASELVLAGLDEGIDIPFDKAQEISERLLTRIEKEGMVPKTIIKDPGQFPGDDFTYTNEEWEQE